MLGESAQPTRERTEKIKTLEESALYINDLANCIPEHHDWLSSLADRLTAEAAELKKSSGSGE